MLGSDLEKLEASISKLTAMLDKSIEYVDDVQSGKIKPDLVVGRELMAAVSAVPEVDCVCVCVCVCARARAPSWRVYNQTRKHAGGHIQMWIRLRAGVGGGVRGVA